MLQIVVMFLRATPCPCRCQRQERNGELTTDGKDSEPVFYKAIRMPGMGRANVPPILLILLHISEW